VRDMRAALSVCSVVTAERGRASALSLVPAPRGFDSRESFTDFDPHYGALPPPAASSRTATRRYSILGAGIAVLVGTMGFPRAAKHVQSEIASSQVAQAEREATQPARAAPAMDDARPMLDAPQYRLELPGERLQIAAPAEEGETQQIEVPQGEAPQAEESDAPPAVEQTQAASTVLTPQAREEALAADASEERDARHRARAERDAEFDVERHAAAVEERIARRRLRDAEEAMLREEEEPAPAPRGVLISDYIKQIEAIQRDASQHDDALPEKPVEAPAAPAEGVPPNPYPSPN